MKEYGEESFISGEQYYGMIFELDSILDNLIIEKKILEEKGVSNNLYKGNMQVIDSFFLSCISEKINLLKKDIPEIDESIDDDMGKTMQQYLSLTGRRQALAEFIDLVDYFDLMFLGCFDSDDSDNEIFTDDFENISWRNGYISAIKDIYYYIEYRLECYNDEMMECEEKLYNLFYGDSDEQKMK